MAIITGGPNQNDIQDFSKYPVLGKVQNLALATAAATAIFGAATQPFYGMNRLVVFAVVYDNFSVGATAATASLGSSGSAQADYLAAATMGVTPGILFPTITPFGVYGANVVFGILITVAGTGTCNVTVYGSAK